MKRDIKILALDNIEATAATQTRTKIHEDTVKQYAADMENGDIFPPMVVFAENGSERFVLADGFHRHRAYINAGQEEAPCEVREGRLRDALIFALGANTQHGMRRTNADKRLCVQMALKDPVIAELSLREIADICRVSKSTVANIRTDMTLAEAADEPDASENNPDKEKPEPADEEDKAVTEDATQNQVETQEVRDACKAIKALPYPGDDALERLDLDPDLVADLEYVSAWCAHAVLAYRNK